MKKKTMLFLYFTLMINILAGPFTTQDIPEDVEKEIRRDYISSSDRRKDIASAKEAYVRLQNKAYDSGIPREDLEIIIVRLHQMYGTNFQKQSAEFDKEAQQYHDMVKKIEERVREEKQKRKEEDKKIKAEIEVLLNDKILSDEIAEKIIKIAEKKYPNSLIAQKYFLEGAIEFKKLNQR